MQSEKLIHALLIQIGQILNRVEKLKIYNLNTLMWRENDISWCILEVLEHLNLYGDFYLLEIERKIEASNTNPEIEFKNGLLGNYFAKSMLPKENFNKMKTFKNKNPLNAKLDKTVIDKFINQQTKLMELLDRSRNVSLNKVKVQTSISSLIKLKLGNTFQFYINHIIRHLAQIDRIQAKMKTMSDNQQ